MLKKNEIIKNCKISLREKNFCSPQGSGSRNKKKKKDFLKFSFFYKVVSVRPYLL